MSFWTIVGIIFILALTVGIGMYSGKKVKNSDDFISGGGKAGSMMVLGTILGSLAGSQASIGTAQLAFNYGFAAWWFTLGAGIGCVFLAIAYTKSLRNSGCVTEMQVISNEYGAFSGSLGSVLGSAGIFLSVLAQTVACTSLISVIFPAAPLALSAFISIAIMAVWVVFGGSWGAGMGGIMKLILLCFAAILSYILIHIMSGSTKEIMGCILDVFTKTDVGKVQVSLGLSEIVDTAALSQRFANLIARGPMKDIGSGVSLLLGVLSTQTYAQAIWSAKTDKAAKTGSLLCALVIPLLGACFIYIGLFMRSNYILQSEVDALKAMGLAVPDMPVLASSLQVFPRFVLNHLPPLISGIVIGTLLINAVASGAGLSLGMATILTKNIYKRFTDKLNDSRKELLAVRLTIVGILVITAIINLSVSTTTINDLGFLSMGLRGTVVFLPLTLALWAPGKINKKAITVSMILAPCAVIAAKTAGSKIDALFVGIFVSAIICVIGFFFNRKEQNTI